MNASTDSFQPQRLTSWPRTPRLNPAELVSRLAEVTGVRLEVEGRCPGGEVGAAYVRWPDGRRSVLTEGSPHAEPLTAIARQAGLPAPRYELVAEVGGACVIVQELRPGAAPTVVDRCLIEAMLACSELMRGLLHAAPQTRRIDLHLRASGPGYCMHEPLADYDRRSARVLDWAREVGAQRNAADGTDLVHMDFHPGNILVRDGRITAVIDWDGAGRGDRLLDLVTLRFDLARRAPDLTDWFDSLLRQTVPADRLRAYWAHMSLRMIDWAIRHHTGAEVDLWIATAEQGITGTHAA
ncbi:phosphotransferase family protein [Catellatospora sichuanensis]|uniref:phosphotransferase family protein n=1 Tax=Catellatospora sichuanensis TaxID=1969805 RepID=UPI001C910BB7|nr:phosphotransferase [Catellatospora sichuanensis]